MYIDMGHFNARYAVPGLMPPNDTNNEMRIMLPEDGSMLLCVHCGTVDDTVNYAIDVRGHRWKSGVIKDPSYNFVPGDLHPWFVKWKSRWPQFMRITDAVPDGCMVLRKIVHGDWTVPVTERYCIPDKDKRYWIIELPAETIPYGQSVLELSVNGKVSKHILNRPPFSIHAPSRRLMHRLGIFQHQRGETLDVGFTSGREGEIRVHLTYKGFAEEFHMPEEAVYAASALVDGDEVALECTADNVNHILHIKVPGNLKVGKWTWSSTYEMWGNKSPLACGDLEITPAVNAYESISKVHDYLYEVWYGDIDYNYAGEYFEGRKVPVNIGGCTSMCSGHVFGRNYDWLYSNSTEFIVHTPARDGMHAVMGVVGHVDRLEDDVVASGASMDEYNILPFLLVDGINDAGLVMSVNVVPAGDKGENLYTYPYGEKEAEICTTMLPRYILDRFDSAETAATWVSNHAALFVPQHMADLGYEVHFLIADKSSAWVVELVDGRAEAIDATGHPVIANFHTHGVTYNEDGRVETPATGNAHTVNNVTLHGAGLERHNIAIGGLADAGTVHGMRELLDRLLYTRTYKTSGHAADPRWDTEFIGMLPELTVESPDSAFDAVYDAVGEAYTLRDRSNPLFWQTVHSSVYDMDNLTLNIMVQEDDGVVYKRKLSIAN